MPTTIVIPGIQYLLITGKSVAADLSETGINTHFVVPLSIIQKTHCAPLYLPTLCFLLKNKDSSISTILLFPFSSNPSISMGVSKK
jgi:hypothetical protein